MWSTQWRARGRTVARSDQSPAPLGRRRPLLLSVAALAVAVAVAVLLLSGNDKAAPRTIVITIPSGTAALVARGKDPHVVPQKIRGTVGDTLEIVNNDRVSHTVGPFLVAAHQRIGFPLRRAGVFTGSCSLHPNDRIALIVRQ